MVHRTRFVDEKSRKKLGEIVEQAEANLRNLLIAALVPSATSGRHINALGMLRRDAVSWRVSLEELEQVRETARENSDEERLNFILPALDDVEWKLQLNGLAQSFVENDPSLSYDDALAHAQQRLLAAQHYDREQAAGGYNSSGELDDDLALLMYEEDYECGPGPIPRAHAIFVCGDIDRIQYFGFV